MWDDDKIENIDKHEVIECIKIFDQELQAFINKITDYDDVVLGKYINSEKKDGTAEIQLEIFRQENETSLSFDEDFFEDYCYSTRKERDAILEKTIGQIKEKFGN